MKNKLIVLSIQFFFLILAFQLSAKAPIKSDSKHVLGDFAQLKKGILPFLDSLKKKYPDEGIIELNFPFAGYFFNRYYVVFSADLAKQILYDSTGAFIKGEASNQIKKTLFAPEGITFMEDGVRWELLHHAFFAGACNPAIFADRYDEIFSYHTKKLFSKWLSYKKGQVFDLYTDITYYTMSVIAHAFFNYDMSEYELQKIVPAFKYILEYIQRREMEILPSPMNLPTKKNRKFKKSIALLNSFYEKLIDHDPQYLLEQGDNYATIIQLLQEFKDPNSGAPLTKEEIKSHIATLFFAGHDTTANFITMLLYQLSKHPKVYLDIQQEIEQNLFTRSKNYFPADTLPVYDAFAKETLRLFCSVPIFARDTTRDVQVGNYSIKKGSTLLLAIATMMQNEQYIPNSKKFDHTRFLKNSENFDPQLARNFIPFSVGLRRCLGQWFALAEARTFIAHYVTSDLSIYCFTKENIPVKLRMVCTGIPNQTIFARTILKNKSKKNETSFKDSAIKTIKMEVVASRYENDAQTIKTIRLAPISDRHIPINYLPGDSLTLHFTSPEGRQIARHFTISSSPTASKNWIEFTVKKEPKGLGSMYVHDILDIASQVEVEFPFFDGVSLPKNIETPLVLVSGGIGITPMISIVKYLLDTDWPGEIYFIHSSKTQELLPYKKLLSNLEKRKNCMVFVALTQNNDKRIDADMIANIVDKKLSSANILVCAHPQMVDSINIQLQKKYNVKKEQITLLSFGSTPQKNYKTGITPTQVSLHNKITDAWIIIENKVFDITGYITEHPGLEVIVDYLGKDATEAFYQVRHTGRAQKELWAHPGIRFVGFLV